jgi:hypothetical protein
MTEYEVFKGAVAVWLCCRYCDWGSGHPENGHLSFEASCHDWAINSVQYWSRAPRKRGVCHGFHAASGKARSQRQVAASPQLDSQQL